MPNESRVMDDAWYPAIRESLDRAHWALVEAKAGSFDRDYQRELKYVLRGFRHADGLSKESPPEAGETQLAYLERVVPLACVVPEDVDVTERDPWLNGVRQFVRVLSAGTSYQQPALEVQQPRYSRSVRQRISDSTFWMYVQHACFEIGDRARTFIREIR